MTFREWFRDTTMPAEARDFEQEFITCWFAAVAEERARLRAENERLRKEVELLNGEIDEIRWTA